MNVSVSLRLLLPALVLAAMPNLNAALGVDLTGGGTPTSCGSCGVNGATVGWSFSVNSPITIDGLGVWDAGSNGLGVSSVPVGLFTSTGTLLASVAVTDLSASVASASPEGSWLFEYFAPLTLTAGDYVIGNVFWDLAPLAQIDSTYTTIPEITLLGGVQGTEDAGFMAPINPFLVPVFGSTMSIQDAAIPEPATMALMGLGLAGLAAFRRRRC
ncbi:MAG: PEP-CTERM sorting domain-containing protein [Bryobacteraceae bacterium]|nr:PEP-CTERM sorting domain-containing protein [Bryobacteraceae bacterium]